MSFFPDTIAASLSGRKVQAALLAQFDFTSETMRLWNGNGLLDANDGTRWKGLGQWGGVTGLEQAINGQAPEANFTLSGIDAAILRLARDEFETEVRGRMVRVLIQFFGVEDAADSDNQRPLDNPFPIWAGLMLKPTFTIDPEGERSVAVSAESIFSQRSRPRHAMYTDADQQKRFPGDRGFEFVADLVNKETTWPDY